MASTASLINSILPSRPLEGSPAQAAAVIRSGPHASGTGVAWTDGSPSCDAIFEAYDAADVLIGTKTATAVGDNTNVGSVGEDRFFSVVHPAGVKRVVVKSSGGGVEVDHLQYGR